MVDTKQTEPSREVLITRLRGADQTLRAVEVDLARNLERLQEIRELVADALTRMEREKPPE